MTSQSRRLAHGDFVQAWLSWRLWLTLGLSDISIRYKRTLLGPLWITLSMSATFVALGMLFSAILKNDVHSYLPYLAAGMVTWNLLSAMANDAPQIFVQSHHIITSLRLPLPVHVLRCAVRNGLIFAHNAVAALIAHLVLGGTMDLSILWLLFSLPLLFSLLFSGGLVLAILGARFRDLGPIIGMAMQFLFFLTPIMWSPADIPQGSKWWVQVNPFYYLLDTVRAPLLGQSPQPLSWAVSILTAVAMGVAAYGLFRRFRRRIAYWL